MRNATKCTQLQLTQADAREAVDGLSTHRYGRDAGGRSDGHTSRAVLLDQLLDDVFEQEGLAGAGRARDEKVVAFECVLRGRLLLAVQLAHTDV